MIIIERIYGFISMYSLELILALIIGFIILIILYMINGHKLKKLSKRYKTLVGSNNNINIEDLLLNSQKDIMELTNNFKDLQKDLSDLEMKQSFSIQKIGFIRYDAYDNVGNELSYSIALLDSFDSGFVITSLYGRENSVGYAKPLKNGDSKIPLSAEEQLAIGRALRGDTVETVF